MSAAPARHLAGVGSSPVKVIPSRILSHLSEEGRVVIRCQIADLPGTDANVAITRTSGRFETVVYATEASPIAMPDTPPSYTIVQHAPQHVLATDRGTDPATAEQWLTAVRTGETTPWTHDADDFDHVKNWILAHAPDGLFTSVTRRGVAIGLGGHAAGGGGAEAAMLTGNDLIASPRCSTSVTRLHGLIARWRRAGTPYTEQLPAALFRQGHGWRVRLVLPRTETER
ncbi:hypothetical protein [Myceligenerans indicum]|uniref:Uncharacterized protein n=1 Tax=Myceligenerans indicum TaxID=2593663 RepID=A0ABS1LKZ7_9MICO|nr:hypothetical protein [Myceligenerans indicum]MBL0886896.1 hypothetical protein [Myceligenerans indicum]